MFVLGGLSQAVADTEEDGRYWFSLYTQGKLPADNFYWSMDTHPRWRNEGQHFDQLILRPSVFYKFNPKTSVWLGYDTIISHPPSQSSQRENRLWQQFQYQFDEVASVTLTSRTRLEQRRREDFQDVGHRLRQMVRVTTPLPVHPKLSLVMFDELFVNLNQTEWGAQRGIDQNRFFIGANWKFSDFSNVETGYLHQFINTRTVDRENHVLMTTVRFNF
ncbi:DUF2490 domain-containing protein [Methylophilus sp. 5]|uniref:DUF2490 domain-containing protein n=1 Tax=Methylophilus sp. 5 TaxID=1112274 RepID=UPI001E6079BD|nr:DUF2490 domain-containing protein [Methylophilus sp. 5]